MNVDPEPPDREAIEEALGHAQARLTELRSLGYDGPAIWAVEDKVNRLLDEWAVTCRGL